MIAVSYVLSLNSAIKTKVKAVIKDCMCKKCDYAEDFKGFAAKHVGEARRLISKGDPEGADLQLGYLERHLKK